MIGYDSPLVNRIGEIIIEARKQTVRMVNVVLVKTYWEIGREIVENESSGKIRAEYGEQSLKNLSKELIQRYGKGFSYPNLRKMRQFYYTYEICSTLSIKSDSNEIFSTPSRKLDKTKVPTLFAKSVL